MTRCPNGPGGLLHLQGESLDPSHADSVDRFLALARASGFRLTSGSPLALPPEVFDWDKVDMSKPSAEPGPAIVDIKALDPAGAEALAQVVLLTLSDDDDGKEAAERRRRPKL